MTRTLVAIMLGVITFAGCSDDSPLPLSEYEKYDVTVWVWTPSGHEYATAVVKGARACGAAAHAFAREKGFAGSRDWSYVCCTHRKNSTCHEKIR